MEKKLVAFGEKGELEAQGFLLFGVHDLHPEELLALYEDGSVEHVLSVRLREKVEPRETRVVGTWRK